MLSHKTNNARRHFLQGQLKSRPQPLRPPWAIEEEAFTQNCTRCHDCITQCETGILINGDGGYPEVNFLLGECTFCEACVNHCPTTALSTKVSPTWNLVATITEQCLAHKDVVCMTCRDQCPEQAITLKIRVNHPPFPMIDTQLCTGCGACYAPCPPQAILINSIESL